MQERKTPLNISDVTSEIFEIAWIYLWIIIFEITWKYRIRLMFK